MRQMFVFQTIYSDRAVFLFLFCRKNRIDPVFAAESRELNGKIKIAKTGNHRNSAESRISALFFTGQS